MNKTAELCDVEMQDGLAVKLGNVRPANEHLLPIGFHPPAGMGISKKGFNDWWRARRIPASRDGINNLLQVLQGFSLDMLAEKSLALSLSDQYWIRPAADIAWESINFFTNDFSEDIGKLLVQNDWTGGSVVSPDNTADGVLRKRWEIVGGVRCLLKGGSGPPWFAQPYREVFASKIAELLFSPYTDTAISVVPYVLYNIEDAVFSRCPNFITVDTEYVSFNQFHSSAYYKKPNQMSYYQQCKEIFGQFGHCLDLLLILDYIVLNEDRHYGNFGMIRDANTGQLLKPAPVFDTGSSLFYDSMVMNLGRIECKPFRKKFAEQIKLVDASLYQDGIALVKDNYRSIFAEVFETSYEDDRRKDRLQDIVGGQIDNLTKRGA